MELHRIKPKLLAPLLLAPLLFGIADAALHAEWTPAWAIPKAGPESSTVAGDKQITLPGSELSLTQAEIDDPFNTPDWFPQEHEPMPRIVKQGNKPDNWACAMCHLASGNGHPQSAKLAGTGAEYILEQLAAFKAGDRKSYLGAFIDDLHVMENDADATRAADWFATLEPRPHQTVIETDSVPETTFDGTSYMRVVASDTNGNVDREPIDGRIIEVPEVYADVKVRNPHGTFITYVPRDSLEKGRKIAMEGTKNVAPCISCHGTDLKGTPLAPALAGAFPTYVVRQIYDFRNGKRTGLADRTSFMSTTSRLMSADDIVNVAAYIGSVDP